jgi:hypothetical protein
VGIKISGKSKIDPAIHLPDPLNANSYPVAQVQASYIERTRPCGIEIKLDHNRPGRGKGKPAAHRMLYARFRHDIYAMRPKFGLLPRNGRSGDVDSGPGRCFKAFLRRVGAV